MWKTNVCLSAIQIQLANSTAYRAAEQINESLNKLSLVRLVRQTVESDLGDNFQSLYRNNSLKLEEIKRINDLLQELVSQAEHYGEQANVNLTMAMDTATRAKDTAGQRKREAEIARHNASNALSDAMQANSEAENALDTSVEFKVNWFSWLPLPSKKVWLQSEKCSAHGKSSKVEEFPSLLFFAETKFIYSEPIKIESKYM